MLNDREWLHTQYQKKRRSARDIADELGCCVKKVQRAMKKWKIRPRSRADACKAAYAAGRRKSQKGKKRSVEARENISKGMTAWWQGRPQEDVDKHADFCARVWRVEGTRKRAAMRKRGGRVARARVPGRGKLCQFLVAELNKLNFAARYDDQPVDIRVEKDDKVFLLLMDGFFRLNKPPAKREERLRAAQARPHHRVIRVEYSGSQFTKRWARPILAAVLSHLTDGPSPITLTFERNGQEKVE